MTPETITRLLASMNAGRLLVVCGAGLSMAPPSSLPSARTVAERCFDKYRLEADPNCDLGLRTIWRRSPSTLRASTHCSRSSLNISCPGRLS